MVHRGNLIPGPLMRLLSRMKKRRVSSFTCMLPTQSDGRIADCDTLRLDGK